MIAMPADVVGDLSAEREAAEETLERTVSDVLGGSATEVERRAVEGNAGDVLVAASEEADLVVVGSKGKSGLRATLLGSVSNHTAHHAHCPVVIVRGTD